MHKSLGVTIGAALFAGFIALAALYFAAAVWVSDPVVDPQAMPPGPLQEIYR